VARLQKTKFLEFTEQIFTVCGLCLSPTNKVKSIEGINTKAMHCHSKRGEIHYWQYIHSYVHLLLTSIIHSHNVICCFPKDITNISAKSYKNQFMYVNIIARQSSDIFLWNSVLLCTTLLSAYSQHRLCSVFLVSRHETTRNSSGDEIANANNFTTTFLITFTPCTPEATEFSEITQNKGHYTIQSHSRSPILVPIESSYTTSY